MTGPIADNTDGPVPTLTQAINAGALAHPGRVAIEDDWRRVTWAELLDECVTMTRLLAERKVQRLGVAAGNEIGHLVALIAAAAARIPAVPVARDWPAAEIGRRFRAAAVDLVLGSSGDEERLRAVTPAPVVTAARAPVPPGPNRKADATDGAAPDLLPGGEFRDVHIIAPTGGTSGRLKFAYLTQANTVSRFITQITEFALPRRGRFLCTTPLFHGGGRSFALCHLYLGGGVLLRQKFDCEQWFADIAGCATTFVVPTMATRLVEAATAPIRPDIRVIISGARLDRDVARRWRARVGGTAFNYYGSVEAGAIAVARLDEMLESDQVDAVGRPAFATRIEFDRPAPTTPERPWSEARVRGPSVAIGTAVDAEGYSPVVAMNPGDLLAPGADEQVRFGGRADDVIITGGVNVYPGSVEQVFRKLDGIVDLALLGVPHPQWGEELVLAVAERGDGRIDEAALRALAARELASYSRPKRYYIAPDLPLTSAGKIDRRALTAMLRESAP